MKILITGACGYVGTRLAVRFAESLAHVELYGIDNLSRQGAETNVATLRALGMRLVRGDVRLPSDLDALPAIDWVVDCAANPCVMAGIGTSTGCTPRQLLEHNLTGTTNLLEFARLNRAGLVLLSSSRVYSIDALVKLPLVESPSRFVLDSSRLADSVGVSSEGIAEDFPTCAPISLYGATKLASEVLALEYGAAFDIPVWINRCGVIGGPGQFGKIDQGVVSFWVYSVALGRPLKYIGFGGTGKQVRDVVTAEDVADLVVSQIQDPRRPAPRILNVGGGQNGALSLLELTSRCEAGLGVKAVLRSSQENRPYDIPYFVTDNSRAWRAWGWRPSQRAEEIVEALCRWTRDHLDVVRTFLV